MNRGSLFGNKNVYFFLYLNVIFAPFRLPVVLEKQTKCDPKSVERVSCKQTLNLLAQTLTEKKKKFHNLSNYPIIIYNINHAKQMPKIFIFY